MTLNLQKKLDISKSIVLDLVKEKDLQEHKAQVVVVLDYSGSMSSLYSRGIVQLIVERLVPIAMVFDDNSEMECFKFHEDVRELSPITLNNLDDYVARKVYTGAMGGTNYAPAIKAVVKQHVGRQGVTQVKKSVKNFFSKLLGGNSIDTSQSKLPTYVIFITDGANFDVQETQQEMKNASNHGVFFQFVGISPTGSFKFPQLEALDNMSDRLIDNANFFQISIDDLALNESDEILYGKLLNEYPQWLKLAKDKNLIL